jgi:hypothetical protein
MEPNNGSSPGTVAATTDVVATAIANAANPSPATPIGDFADQAYDKAVAKEEPKSEPSEPKQEPAKETPTTEEPSTVHTEDEPGGYFADEGLDDGDAPTQVPPPTPQANPLPQSFTAQEQYVAQNIGQPITVRIKDTPDGAVRSVQAYSPENLPDNFYFATERDRLSAQLGFDNLSRKAETLIADYNNQQAQKQAQDFSSQEDRDIQRDIATLQRAKVAGKDGLDKFKFAPNDPRFEDDPAVKEMQQVLDYYNTENQTRWRDSQASGRQYRPLSYRDAFKIYRADNPVTPPAQKKEDTQRKEITRSLAGGNRGSGEEPRQARPKLPRNASIDQIAHAYGL